MLCELDRCFVGVHFELMAVSESLEDKEVSLLPNNTDPSEEAVSMDRTDNKFHARFPFEISGKTGRKPNIGDDQCGSRICCRCPDRLGWGKPYNTIYEARTSLGGPSKNETYS